MVSVQTSECPIVMWARDEGMYITVSAALLPAGAAGDGELKSLRPSGGPGVRKSLKGPDEGCVVRLYR
jgi:hypothetical protein